MKPLRTRRRTEVIQISYWICHDQNHRHINSGTAQRCISKQEKRETRRKWNEAVMADLKRRHDNGETYKSIGHSYGVSASRIGGLVAQWKRIVARRIQHVNQLESDINAILGR